MAKQVREIDRIRWKPHFCALTNLDTNIGLNALVERFKCPEGKATFVVWLQLEAQVKSCILVSNRAILNMMKPLDL